tara:strand:+ start:58682 stop:58816 length:135 start_codon:yes stop_codon:yes gene_type:complete
MNGKDAQLREVFQEKMTGSLMRFRKKQTELLKNLCCFLKIETYY